MYREFIIIDNKSKGDIDSVIKGIEEIGREWKYINYNNSNVTDIDNTNKILIIDTSNITEESSIINIRDYLNYNGYRERTIEEIKVEELKVLNKEASVKTIDVFALIVLGILLFFVIIFIKNRKNKREKIFKE